jgi:hypothetical protein
MTVPGSIDSWRQRVHPASLYGDQGAVILEPEGTRLVYAALELTCRMAARNGGALPTEALTALRQVIKAANDHATGCAPATSGRRFTLRMPSSAATVTVAEAAAIWGVSPQAIRAAIRDGRLTARKHGGSWLLLELQVRQAAVARRRRARVVHDRAVRADGRRSGRERPDSALAP